MNTVIDIIDRILDVIEQGKDALSFFSVRTKILCPESANGEYISRTINGLIKKNCLYDFHVLGTVLSWEYSLDEPKSYMLRFRANEEKLRDYRKELIKKKPNKPITHLLYKDELGNFYFNEKKIEMNKDALYYYVLDILYSHHDQDGFISYGEIVEHLKKKEGIEIPEEPLKQIKQIRNTLNQSLFKTVKINGKPLKNQIPLTQEKIIDTKRGEGLILKNPSI